MDTVKIGWGKQTLSLDEPLSLFGQMYLRISEKIHDPLMATALCVDGGEGQDAVIFLTCDVEGFRAGILDMIRQKAAALDPTSPVDAIVASVTHTHTGGCLSDTPEKSPDGERIYSGAAYREFFSAQCAEAIRQAWQTRAPGAMAYGYGYAVTGHSRRVIYTEDMSIRQPNAVSPNGHGVMYGKTNDPVFSHYEAGADHFLNLMFTFDANEKLTGIVVNTPCPSQTSEHFCMQSADYWNEVRQMVAEEYGEDVYVLPQCAAAGDLSPRILHYGKAQARRMALKYDMGYDPANVHANSVNEYNKCMTERYDIAERLLAGIRDVYGWAKKDLRKEVTVCHTSKLMSLSRRIVSEAEKVWCEETLEQMRQNLPTPDADPAAYRRAVTHYNSIKERNERALARYQEQQTTSTFDTTTHVVRVGDIAFCTTRFELFMDYMHRLQARSPFIQTFVMQLSGDEGANYLTTIRGEASKGYSAALFDNMVSPAGGQQWVDEALEILEDLAKR